MVQTFSTNSNNDIFIGSDGNLSLSFGLRAVLLACETATKAQLGEMILTINNGIPNFQTVWVGSPNYQIFQSYLRNTILAVPGVLSVESIDLNIRQNTLNYTATIVTQYGTGILTNG